MLADAPLENSIKNARKLIESDVYKTVEEKNVTNRGERKRRKKKHRNKQRQDRPNKGKKKKGLGKLLF